MDGVHHPTVKPLALMRWLTRLVTPLGGVVVVRVITPEGVTMVQVVLDHCDPRQIGWAVDAVRGRVRSRVVTPRVERTGGL